jgi:hypothetical protein
LRTSVVIGLNAVILSITEDTPLILTLNRPEFVLSPQSSRKDSRNSESARFEALPFGPFDPDSDRTLELGLLRWVREQTGLNLGYIEQLYTFGNRNRDPIESRGGPRVVSVAYLAFVRESKLAGTGHALWRDWYHFLPWEDWRTGRPPMIDAEILPVLSSWIESAPDLRVRKLRRERCDINFGRSGAPWVPERVLERYEILYEVGLASEAVRDGQPRTSAKSESVSRRSSGATPKMLGQAMAFDHRRILATAIARLRGKLKYRPVVFELLPESFTLFQLQRVLEALAGARLHKQNLRRLVETGRLVEGTGQMERETGGRPAELFRFRREVLRERPAAGVGLPGLGLR